MDVPVAPLLTVPEVAAILRVPNSTVYEWCRGGMPHYKLGRHIRFDERLLHEWIANHRVDRPPTRRGGARG